VQETLCEDIKATSQSRKMIQNNKLYFSLLNVTPNKFASFNFTFFKQETATYDQQMSMQHPTQWQFILLEVFVNAYITDRYP
jgi:hypothetical protein